MIPNARQATASTAPPPGVATVRGVLGHALLDDDFLRNPYPAYSRLRESAPLVWSDEFFGGAWLLTRHADVELVLRDARFSAQRTGGWVMRGSEPRTELRGFQRLFARAMIFLDVPDHQRIRQVIAAAFRPADLQRLTPRLEQAITDALAAVNPEVGFDFVSALARPLPAQAIAMLMGLDGQPDADEFIEGSETLAEFLGASEPSREQALRAQDALLVMATRFESLLQARRRETEDPLRDDAFDRLLRAERSGHIRGGAELLAQCVMLLFAGHETTRHLLANGLQLLLRHPEAWQALQQDPALIPGAVREMLRFDSPVQYTGRRVATAVSLHGQTLRRGDLVVALIGAANRDPRQHERPDDFDIARRSSPSLAFGQGPHVCIGASLTLMEAQMVFTRLLERWPGLQLAETASLPRMGSPLYRGPKELRVRLSDAASAAPQGRHYTDAAI